MNIFLDHYATPKAVFYVEASKDFVEYNIKANMKCPKLFAAKIKEFEFFLTEK